MPEIKYCKGLEWNKKLTAKMLEFEKQTGKSAVYRGVITGGFEHWMYVRKSKAIKKSTKKKNTRQRLKCQKV